MEQRPREMEYDEVFLPQNSTFKHGVTVEPAHIHNCAFMLYSDHRESFWSTAPCYTSLAKYWICKKPALSSINSSPRVDDVWCATGATFVGDSKCARYHSLWIDALLDVISSSTLVSNTLIEENP